MARSLYSSIEVLESRIAPAALTALHPLPNIVAGIGKTGASIDLGNIFDPNGTFDTMVTFTTNFDTDPNTPGIQPGIIQIELFDSLAPLTVQNFLSYINTTAGQGNFADTFFSRLVAGFVLQGGGYTVSNPSTHIAVGPTVHNEFNSANPISNTEGTVAMAKTGLSPNTATSEFFINLADNSSNLDNQNGGFTVFGKVTAASMVVVNEIAALSTADLSTADHNSALTTVPYQGALPTSGVPTASQLIEVTNISVQAPTQGVSPGVTFNSVSFAPATQGGSSSFVTGSISGQTLNLKYAPGASGVATVSVTGTDLATQTQFTEMFNVTVQPNLIDNSVSDTLQNIIVPGDSGHIKVQLTNNGAALAKGSVEIKVFLAPTTVGAATPATVGSGDLLIADFTTKVNIASGASSTVSGNVKLGIPTLDQLVANGSDFQVIEQITSSSQTTVASLFTDDKATDNGSTHALFNAFGSFSLGTDSSGHAISPRTNSSFSYLDASNHLVTLSYKGDGGALLIPNGDGTVSLQTGDFGLEGNSSTSALSLKIAGTPGNLVNAATHTTFQDITLTNPVGNVSLGKADVTGNIDVDGGATTVTFGNLVGDGTGVNISSFHLGASNTPTTVQLGSVNDYNLTADSAVKSLKALSWTNDTTGTATITAPALTSLNVTGDVEANVTIAASVPAATATVQSFTVGGVLRDSIVQIGGNVGTVVIGAMDTSDFLVGTKLTTGTPVLPAQRSDFSSLQSIGSFTIKGVPSAVSPFDLIASNIAAADFGSISVLGTDSNPEANTFGFIADIISRYQNKSDAFQLLNLSPGLHDQKASYEVNVLGPTGPA